MNYSFALLYDGLVVETIWSGDLNGQILAAGALDRLGWIQDRTDKEPLAFLSDFSKSNMKKVTETDMRLVASIFHDFVDQFPGAHWIYIVSTDLQFGLARMWQVIAEPEIKNSYVVRSRPEADQIIKGILGLS